MRLARRIALMSHDTTRHKPPTRLARPNPERPPKEHSALLGSGEEWSNERGTCWIATPSVEDYAVFDDQLADTLTGPPSTGMRLWPDGWRKPHVTILDIETCGFSAFPVFMIGLLRIDNTGASFQQGIARDYTEEAALLDWTHRMLSDTGVVVTFNGKSFDMRYIRERSAYHRLGTLDEPPHVDLLHIARRLWGDDLPNCRLQTLESSLCGRLRHNDIPGFAIPDVYHHFVRTGDAKDFSLVAKHNVLDIVTLAELYVAAWHETANRNANDRRERT